MVELADIPIFSFFICIKVEENRGYRLHVMMEKAGDSIFINMREVVNRFQLKTGRYVVIPSTYDPHVAGNFMLRIFTEKSSNARFVTCQWKLAVIKWVIKNNHRSSCVTTVNAEVKESDKFK